VHVGTVQHRLVLHWHCNLSLDLFYRPIISISRMHKTLTVTGSPCSGVKPDGRFKVSWRKKTGHNVGCATARCEAQSDANCFWWIGSDMLVKEVNICKHETKIPLVPSITFNYHMSCDGHIMYWKHPFSQKSHQSSHAYRNKRFVVLGPTHEIWGP